MYDYHNLTHHYHQNIVENHRNEISKKTTLIIFCFQLNISIITIDKHGPELHRNVPGIQRHSQFSSSKHSNKHVFTKFYQILPELSRQSSIPLKKIKKIVSINNKIFLYHHKQMKSVYNFDFDIEIDLLYIVFADMY
jgi:hypothetical protein